MDNILEVREVSKAYANHQALDRVSLDVPRGQVYGLLGPNGAGKTTLIRIINHITAPDSGSVTIDGHPLTAADIYNIGYLPEERGLYKKMKVGDQALFFARLKGIPQKEAVKALKEWFERLDITSWWDKKVEELSKGMAQKVQFIVTVLHRPKLLIFDEPFSGFDPINANILKSEILKLRDEGASIIFSTHNMGSVEELCDKITLINKSRNILTGRVEDIRRDYSDHRYELTFTGDTKTLVERLVPVVRTIEPAESAAGVNRLRFTLNTSDDLRQAVAIANESAALQSFVPLMPSMDEIFIRAVEANNEPLQTPPAL